MPDWLNHVFSSSWLPHSYINSHIPDEVDYIKKKKKNHLILLLFWLEDLEQQQNQ